MAGKKDVGPIDTSVAWKQRLEAIGARIKKLHSAGFYSEEDVTSLRSMIKSKMCLVQIEWMLTDAEELARRTPAGATA